MTTISEFMQHNMKEENILYPIMDQCIASEADNLQQS